MTCSILLSVALVDSPAKADGPKIAVAANFSKAMKALAETFQKITGSKPVISYGATGSLTAQIENGAPYEIFLAADRERPKALVDKKLAIPESQFSYAMGQLVLLSGSAKNKLDSGEILRGSSFHHLAVANPKVAPYGQAAKETLLKMGLWNALQPRIVQGQDITQTYQFVSSGNAELGFVALSQVKKGGGNYWLVPENMHQAILQDAVLLEKGRGDPLAVKFMNFLRTPEAHAIANSFGYQTVN